MLALPSGAVSVAVASLRLAHRTRQSAPGAKLRVDRVGRICCARRRLLGRTGGLQRRGGCRQQYPRFDYRRAQLGAELGRGATRGSLRRFRAHAARGRRQRMLRLAGFGLDLPAVGQCAEPNHERAPSMPLSPLGRVEFLDAGDVTLRTSSTNALLATRALPAVTDLIAGVVYTTRDRASDPLPAAATYTLTASGGLLRAFNVNANAPAQLGSINVGGTPLAELSSVAVRSAIALSWNPGLGHDFVYVEFRTQDGSATTRCTFRDDAGVGTVPASAFVGMGLGEVSLHRVHSEPFTSGSVDAGEVRFRFRTERDRRIYKLVPVRELLRAPANVNVPALALPFESFWAASQQLACTSAARRKDVIGVGEKG